MATILVTGADGFTGRHLCAALSDQGHKVHGLVSTIARKQFHSPVQFHRGDLEDQGSLRTILRACQPEKIVHLAAISFVAHTDPNAIYRTNLLGTRNLLPVADEQRDGRLECNFADKHRQHLRQSATPHN